MSRQICAWQLLIITFSLVTQKILKIEYEIEP